MEYKKLAERLAKECLQKGADAAEVYLETGRNLDIEIRNGEVERTEEAAFHGAGFRVFSKGKIAFSHCNDFTDPTLNKAIESAVAYAQVTTADENNVLPENKEMTEVEGLYDPAIKQIAMEDKISIAKEVEKLAMKDARITKSDGARFSDGEGEIFLANSKGLSKSYKASFCTYGVSVVAEKEDQKTNGTEYCTTRFFNDLKAPEEVAHKAAEKAYGMLDPKMVKTQKAAVIFDPDVASAILRGILFAIDGERVLQGASFLGDNMGQKIASEGVTLIDDGIRAKGIRSRPFDGEGVPTQRRVILDKGVLKGFMYNTIVAKRAGVKSTGNAFRSGFSSLPGIQAHSFFMQKGPYKPEEIIKATQKGLLLKGVTGYGINPVNGNFSGGAYGFWIENGKVAFPVRGLTIAGAAFDMLKDIDMVGDDLDLNRPITAPTFRIKVLQIGGE